MSLDRYTWLLGSDREIIDNVLVWFGQICSIPHRSGREKALAEMLEQVCVSNGWQSSGTHCII